MADSKPQPQQPKSTHENFMKEPYFRKWYPKWISNAMDNYPVIKKEFEKKDMCMSRMPRPMNRPCMILGGGASLDRAAPLLKNWNNPVIVGASSALIPVKWGRKPDFICAFDSLWNSYNDQLKLDNKKTSWEGSTLLTHPNAEPKMIKAWKWDKFYYRRVFPGQEFFEFTFPLMFPWIKVGLRFSGCVVNNALTIASFLGYNPIFLAGVDFGWKDDIKFRCDNWEQVNNNWQKVYMPKMTPDHKKTVITVKGNMRSTRPFVQFKVGFLSIFGSSKNMQIINCSDENGIMNEFPHADVETVIKEQGWGDYGFDRNEVNMKAKEFFKEFNENKYIIKNEGEE